MNSFEPKATPDATGLPKNLYIEIEEVSTPKELKLVISPKGFKNRRVAP
jgi:hypothetical protein